MSTWAIILNFVGLAVLVIVILRLRRIETKMQALSPVKAFWANLQTKLVKDLTHPEVQFEEPDALMAKLEDLTLTPEERPRLNELILQRTTDPQVPVKEQRRAKLLLLAMEEVLGETLSPNPLEDVQLVGVKSEPTPDE